MCTKQRRSPLSTIVALSTTVGETNAQNATKIETVRKYVNGQLLWCLILDIMQPEREMWEHYVENNGHML